MGLDVENEGEVSSSSAREIGVEDHTKLLKFRYGAAAEVCPSGPLLRKSRITRARGGHIMRTRVYAGKDVQN